MRYPIHKTGMIGGNIATFAQCHIPMFAIACTHFIFVHRERRAIALDPQYVDAYNNRANTLFSLRRFEEVLATCDKALALKPERLNPAKGLARVFSLNGLAELAKALAKFTVLALTAGLLLWRDMGSILSLGGQGLAPALSGAASLLLNSFLVLCGALVSIAALDVPYQYWRHHQQLRMNRQDLREELKETEGKPEVKSRQRALQREVARRRMMQEVPRADVVVTNPTHFAVALRYRPETMAAPRVVAKGADLVAQRIRGLAAEHGVPLLSAPPLARALYHGTRLGQEIPAGLYQAVAQVLAYVYALRRQRREGGADPVPPTDLPVPDEHAVRGEETSE